MAYFGKEFKFEKEDNFTGFLGAIGLPAEEIEKVSQYKPTVKIEKDGDTYTYTSVTPVNTKKVTFKSGVEFEDEIRPGIFTLTTYNIDGDTVTQLVKAPDGRSATFKREFTGDKMKATITVGGWDGVATRYYTAA